MNVCLLGDSIFDSRRQLPGLPDMAQRVETELTHGSVHLLAETGSRLVAIPDQISRIPPGSTHAVVSIGGNDLLDLGRQRGFTQKGLSSAVGVFLDFQRRYGAFCDDMRATGLKTGVCTIYTPPLGDPFLKEMGAAVLEMANAAITAEAIRRGLAVIDLSRVCHQPADFVDPIHPSDEGADKIATAIADWITADEPASLHVP